MPIAAEHDRAGLQSWHRGLWIALILISSVAGSYVYACAAPFAAIAALATLRLTRIEGLTTVAVALIANQLIGFGLLAYPQTAETYLWGAIIVAATFLAYAVASGVVRQTTQAGAQIALALCAAFLAYEVMMYAAAIMLSRGSTDFSVQIVGQVLAINVAACVAVAIAYRLIVAALPLVGYKTAEA